MIRINPAPMPVQNREDHEMPIANTTYLRNLLLTDAATCLGAGVVMAAGASFLAPLLALPSGLLFWAGLALFPFAALLIAMARRAEVPRFMLIDIAAINVLWVAASFGIMLGGMVQPNLLGTLFITAQALTVALLAVLQIGVLRRTSAMAA